MNSMTKAWTTKAEAELATAIREAAVTDEGNDEAVCLHAKACAMYYLRARLEEAEVSFPLTSHLVVLLELCLEVEPGWEGFRQALRFLTTSADQALSPESGISHATATQALERAQAFRDAIRLGMANWTVSEPVG